MDKKEIVGRIIVAVLLLFVAAILMFPDIVGGWDTRPVAVIVLVMLALRHLGEIAVQTSRV